MRGGRFAGFLVAGGVATTLNYLVFGTLYLVGLHYLLAAATGYVTGIAVSYAINRRVVFRHAVPVGHRGMRYLVAYLLALTGQLVLLELLVLAGVAPLVANALALVIVVVVNYAVISRFVFPASASRG